MHNTGFDVTNFTYGTSINSSGGNVNLFFGYNDKNSAQTVLFNTVSQPVGTYYNKAA